MKKLCLIMAVILLMGSISVIGAKSGDEYADADVIAEYKSEFKTEQGVNNWYFCAFDGNKVVEMKYDGASAGWKYGTNQYPSWPQNGGAMTPATATEVGFKFIVPEKGMIRLKGEVWMPMPDSVRGDGVAGSIYKGTEKLWSGDAKYGSSPKYDLILSVRRGEELYFKINAKLTNYYDWTIWWPTVEYIAADFVEGSDGYSYYQKKDGVMTEMTYSDEKEGYVASDGLAFISNMSVMATKEYSVVKRFTVSEQGRYRVYAEVDTDDIRGGGNIINVYKNGEKVWSQLFTDEDGGVLDVRIFSNEGDTIDVEACVNKFSGYNCADWRCEISKFVGTLFCEASTSEGFSHSVINEFSLSSLIGTTQGNGIEFITERRDLKKPMTYNTSTRRWENDDENFVATVTSAVVNKGQRGYVTPTTVFPGDGTDTIIEVTVQEDGILRIEGDMGVSAGDGVVSKILHNGRLLWSSRVGGERPVRWDEAYDTSYFQQNVNVVTDVKVGDKLTFLYDQWRKSSNDLVDISNVMFRYIDGDILSETTKWKLENSIVVDVEGKCVYKGGSRISIDVFAANGKTYVAKSDAAEIFESASYEGIEAVNIGGVDYLPLRALADSEKSNVVWAADRLVLIYDGIPVLFGYSELSEIKTALKGGVLFD